MASTVNYNDLYRIFDGVSFDERGFAEQEVIRDYTVKYDGRRKKTVVEYFNKPVEILLNGVWTNLHTLFGIDNEQEFLTTPSTLMTKEHEERFVHYYNLTRSMVELNHQGTVLVDTADYSNIRLRGRDYHKHVMEKEAENDIAYSRDFVWLDGASDTPGVIIMNVDFYDRVYTVSDVDGDGNAELTFVEPKEVTGGVRPYYEKIDGKTYIYVNHFSGGGGVQDNPFIISNEADLAAITSSKAAWYALDRDIVISSYNTGTGWVPIDSFNGTLDGRGYQIKGLYVNKATAHYCGLFGSGMSGDIRNLRITDALIITNVVGTYHGILAGYKSGGTIERVTVSGKVTVNNGIASAYMGGMLGIQVGGTTSDCFADVEVSSYGDNNGGFVGVFSGGTMNRCMSIGKVIDLTIAKSNANLGGFAGSGANSASVRYCFWDMQTSAMTKSSGMEAVTQVRGLTTADLKDYSKFRVYLDTTGNGFWDFDLMWFYSPDYNKGYPELRVMKKYLLGKGTLADPFMIYDEDDLNQVRHFQYWANFKLGDDIKLTNHQTGSGFKPFGYAGNSTIGGFVGTFDGNGKYIANLFISEATVDYIGLFRFLVKGTVKNLELVDCDVTGRGYTGGLVGYVTSGARVSNCRVTKFASCKVTGRASYLGAMIGSAPDAFVIEDCVVEGVVTSNNSAYSAGFIGYLTGSGTIKRCYSSKCTINGVANYNGGFVAHMYVSSPSAECISDCYSDNDVYGGSADNGGFVGYYYMGRIHNCISYSRMIGGGQGFAGYMHPNNYTSWNYYSENYFDRDKAMTVSASNVGNGYSALAKYTAEMKHPSLFMNASWDTALLWTNADPKYSDGYPVLKTLLPLDSPILGFRNEYGKYFTDKNGNLLRYLEYGTLVAGVTATPKPVWIQNNADFAINTLRVWIDPATIQPGITVEISQTNSPFTPQAEIQFGGTYAKGDSAKFYVRFGSAVTVKNGGTFDLRAKASPA